MSFHEIRFPVALSFGSGGGPERRVEIVTLANGHEERNAPWSQSRRRYDAGLGLRGLDDLEEVVAFFEARGGQLCGFRWKDWADFKSCRPSAQPGALDQPLGTGDGSTVTFQLVKVYASGPAEYRREIRKPVAGSVTVAADGVLTGGFVADPATGRVTFDTAPGAGVVLTAGFEFDVPVRFDTDRVEVSLAAFSAGETPALPVVELRV